MSLKTPNQPSNCPKRGPVEPIETHQCLFWMDSLKFWDFSSFIIFSDDPWSLLISFRQLFNLPLVVQCCYVICEWPLSFMFVNISALLCILSPPSCWNNTISEESVFTVEQNMCFTRNRVFVFGPRVSGDYRFSPLRI